MKVEPGTILKDFILIKKEECTTFLRKDNFNDYEGKKQHDL